MRPPETAVEVWLARDGWNQIDRRKAKERARNRLALVGLFGLLFLAALIVTSEWRSPQNLVGILGAVLFMLFCVWLLMQVLKAHAVLEEICGPLTPAGRALLAKVLKQVVGPNNTMTMELGEDPPPDTHVVQRSITAAMSAEELALLEPLFDQVNQKWNSKAREMSESLLTEMPLIGAGRAAFSLAADLRRGASQKAEARSKLLRLTERVAALPTDYEKDNPEKVVAMRSAIDSWFAFKDLVKAK